MFKQKKIFQTLQLYIYEIKTSLKQFKLYKVF